jgi:putative hydrolase of the HAD superfamily
VEHSRNRSWVVFDLGEVLTDSPTHLAELAGLMGVVEPDFAPAYWRHRRAYDEGGPGTAYWREIGRDIGVDVSDALVTRLIEVDSHAWTTLHPDSLPLLLDVKATGCGLALLSNIPVELAARVRTREWSELFDLLVFSCDVGAMKPQPEIYRAVEEGIADVEQAATSTPSSLTFFDDRSENVAAAIEAGWRARVWAGHADARSFLAEVGLLKADA